MLSNNNRLIIASAGSGKTTILVEEALSHPDRQIAILTYTNNNANEIEKKFLKKIGGIPKHVNVATWFTFLLHECARPYQRSVYKRQRVKTIHFPTGRSALGAPYSNTERYYFRYGEEIYSDKISRFVIDCETNTKGLVTQRLCEIYEEIFIDEFQDLSGYDLDLLEVLLKAGIRMVIVGDPRQCTYTTNNSAKNRQYRGMGILDLVQKWETKNLCRIENHAISYRCNQKICDFADMLWPEMVKTISQNNGVSAHDGIFVVSKEDISNYIRRFNPVILRYDMKTDTYGYRAVNFGAVKGLEFDRVLILPHGPMRKYLKSGNVIDVKGSLEKFYVAVTRARHSVAFVHNDKCAVGCTEWHFLETDG